MRVDLLVHPFGADVGDMVALAREAEDVGVDGLWVTDHFSASVFDLPWSRDAFVVLGAWAAVTGRVRLGPLVANVVNRHPAVLASAADSVMSLAPGRFVLGVGSGAAPGSRFAREHVAVGRRLGDDDERRRRLRESIAALRSIWRGESRLDAVDGVGFTGLSGVVEPGAPPPIVVGASAWPTVEVGLECADGVNLRDTSGLAGHLDRLADRPPGFEVSVLGDLLDAVARPSWGRDLAGRGVDRLVLGVSAPYPAGRLGDLLADLGAGLGTGPGAG